MWCWILCMTVWAQEVRLGVFPIQTDVLSEEEIAVLQEELTQASQEHFQIEIISSKEMRKTLSQISIPIECSQGGCEPMIARMMGLHRFLSVTVQERSKERVFRISLYDPNQNLIILSNRISQPAESAVEGLAKKLISSLQKESVVLAKDIFLVDEKIEMIDDHVEVKTSIKAVEEQGFESVVVPAGLWADPEGMEYSMPSFLMMKSEVTQELYQEIMKKKPSYFQRCGGDCPVERVSWYDVLLFSNALNAQSDLPSCYEVSQEGVIFDPKCTGWRLPTDIEWLYAASGAKEKSFLYGGSNTIDENSWYRGNAGQKTHRICEKKENPLGLCDMSGNVWEWVWDWKNSFDSSSSVDPTGPTSGTHRVIRGGSWDVNTQFVRVSFRYSWEPSKIDNGLGVRLVRSASDNSYAPLR